jgi:hypothetical protein
MSFFFVKKKVRLGIPSKGLKGINPSAVPQDVQKRVKQEPSWQRRP